MRATESKSTFLFQQCTFVEGQELHLSSSNLGEGGILIQGGVVVNADMQRKADVYIQGGLIQAVGPNLKVGHHFRPGRCNQWGFMTCFDVLSRICFQTDWGNLLDALLVFGLQLLLCALLVCTQLISLVQVPEGARVIDASGKFVMPGMYPIS